VNKLRRYPMVRSYHHERHVLRRLLSIKQTMCLRLLVTQEVYRTHPVCVK
jgi:hypothetical protein